METKSDVVKTRVISDSENYLSNILPQLTTGYCMRNSYCEIWN